MNLFAALAVSKGGSPVRASSGYYGSPYTDIFGRTPAPSPTTLVREWLSMCYACGKLNADGVANTPLRLYVKTGKAEKPPKLRAWGWTKSVSDFRFRKIQKDHPALVAGAADVEEVTSHPLLDLWRKPTGSDQDSVAMTGHAMVRNLITYLDIVGRAYIYKDYDKISVRAKLSPKGKVPQQLWLLPPQYVTEVGLSGLRPIDYYLYSGLNGQVRYEPEELAAWREFNPEVAGYVGGWSAMRAAYEQIYLNRMFDGSAGATLRNGGRPQAIFSLRNNPDMPIGKAEAMRMKSAMRREFAQASNGGLFISEFDGDLQPWSAKITEMMSPAILEMMREVVCACYGVPTTKVNRKDSNRASAVSGDYAHAQDAIKPRCNNLMDGLNHFIVSDWDDTGRLFFAFDDPTEPYNVDDLEQSTAAFGVAAATANDIRAVLGLTPLGPEGDVRFIPNNMTPLDDKTGLPVVKPQPALPAPPSPGSAGGKEPVEPGPKPTKEPGAGGKNSGKMNRKDVAGDTSYSSAPPLNVSDVADTMRHLFDRQHQEVKKRMDLDADSAKFVLPSDAPDLDHWDEKMAAILAILIGAYAQNAAADLLEEYDLPVLINPTVADIKAEAQKLTLKFCQETNATTTRQLNEALDDLRQSLAKGIVKGDGRVEMRQRVQDIFEKADDARADLIAQTEATRAHHMGQIRAARRSGILTKKRWIPSPTACVRCIDYASQGPIPLDQPFDADDYGDIDGPPAHPNCLICTLAFSR